MAIPLLEGSPLRHLQRGSSGINAPQLFVARKHSFFAWHTEDMDLFSSALPPPSPPLPALSVALRANAAVIHSLFFVPTTSVMCSFLVCVAAQQRDLEDNHRLSHSALACRMPWKQFA